MGVAIMAMFIFLVSFQKESFRVATAARWSFPRWLTQLVGMGKDTIGTRLYKEKCVLYGCSGRSVATQSITTPQRCFVLTTCSGCPKFTPVLGGDGNGSEEEGQGEGVSSALQFCMKFPDDRNMELLFRGSLLPGVPLPEEEEEEEEEDEEEEKTAKKSSKKEPNYATNEEDNDFGDYYGGYSDDDYDDNLGGAYDFLQVSEDADTHETHLLPPRRRLANNSQKDLFLVTPSFLQQKVERVVAMVLRGTALSTPSACRVTGDTMTFSVDLYFQKRNTPKHGASKIKLHANYDAAITGAQGMCGAPAHVTLSPALDEIFHLHMKMVMNASRFRQMSRETLGSVLQQALHVSFAAANQKGLPNRFVNCVKISCSKEAGASWQARQVAATPLHAERAASTSKAAKETFQAAQQQAIAEHARLAEEQKKRIAALRAQRAMPQHDLPALPQVPPSRLPQHLVQQPASSPSVQQQQQQQVQSVIPPPSQPFVTQALALRAQQVSPVQRTVKTQPIA